MKCQSCNENEATVHLTQVVGGNIRKMHYCEACARKEGVTLETPTSIADLLMSPAGILPSPRSSGTACPKCGMTRADFKKGARLGCAKCYDTFTDDLMVLIQSMQHATQHRGKRPTRVNRKAVLAEEMETLKEALKRAISAENFEEAARLRDRMRQKKDEMASAAREAG